MAGKAKPKKTEIEKVVDVLLGTIVSARDKISDAIDELIEKAEEKAREVKEKLEKEEGEEEEEEKTNVVLEQLEKIARSLGIVTKKQIAEMEARIDKLLRKDAKKKKK